MKRLVRLGLFAAVVVGIHSLPARAEFTRIDGRVVVPVESLREDEEGKEGNILEMKAGLVSSGGELSARVQRALRSANGVLTSTSINGSDHRRHDQDEHGSRRNALVNDPALDHVEAFPELGVPPFEFGTQSETSMVSRGRHIVVGYNTSAGAHVEFFPGQGLFFTQILISGFSVSHDGGRSWKSGFVPGIAPELPFTFGDPSLAMDRQGNVFYASLGIDAQFNGALIVNKSSDFGETWNTAKVVVTDNGSDKEWLAIGPDPANRSRDNLYITWTSFTEDAGQLWLARSTDAGATWQTKVIFAPEGDSQNTRFALFSNPVVDPLTGRLYVPFLHVGNFDTDNVRMLISDDGGGTFRLVAFNLPGQADPFGFSNVWPGILNDCGNMGSFRNALKQGASPFPGRFGTFAYEKATRLITQPSAAVLGGRVFLAVNSSTSPFIFDPEAGSEIRVIYSLDGGDTWAEPITVAPSTTAEPQHVLPAIAVSDFGNKAFVGYYVQQQDEKLRTDIATLKIAGKKFKVKDRDRLSSVAFDITPSNVHLSNDPRDTTNWDSFATTCYDIGEYMSVDAPGFFEDDGRPRGAWGDNRRQWNPPPGSLVPGVHPQADVFFGHPGD